MKPVTRDLLILRNQSKYSETEIEREATFIQGILPATETLDMLCRVMEVVEISRHRISNKPNILGRTLRQNTLRSFQFIHHRN